MSKLYTEAGFLSDVGKETFSNLEKEIKVLLNDAKDDNEVRIITSLIQHRVGTLASNHCILLKKDKDV